MCSIQIFLHETCNIQSYQYYVDIHTKFMERKKTNLSLAADVSTSQELLQNEVKSIQCLLNLLACWMLKISVVIQRPRWYRACISLDWNNLWRFMSPKHNIEMNIPLQTTKSTYMLEIKDYFSFRLAYTTEKIFNLSHNLSQIFTSVLL